MKRLVEKGLSQRRSCALVEIARSLYHYEPGEEDEELMSKLKAIAKKHKRYGYRRAWALLRRDGQDVNHKRIQRLWKKLELSVPRGRCRKHIRRGGQVPLKALYPDHVWTYDFMLDATSDGRVLKILTVVDEFTRECKAIEADRRMTAVGVVRVLIGVMPARGGPQYLRSDNGPEFIAEAVQKWLESRGTKTYYIAPASPWENAFGESFNDKLRDECLNMEDFASLQEARIICEHWRRQYNQVRPHSSLGYMTPSEYRRTWKVGSLPPAPGSLRSLWVRGGRKGNSLVKGARKLQPVES